MDVRIVRVPVIDGYPIEPGAEIVRDIAHQLAGERLEVADLGQRRVGHRQMASQFQSTPEFFGLPFCLIYDYQRPIAQG